MLLVVVLLVIAGFLREDFVFVLLYLLLGIFIIGYWWSRKVIHAIGISRDYPVRAFNGEKIDVSVKIKNSSRLPAVWLHLRENLPLEIRSGGVIQQVVSIGAKSITSVNYQLDCRHRGYYKIGPLDVLTGDIFGIAQNIQRSIGIEYLTVFPKIVPLRGIKLLSHAPMGTLRYREPIFEDPSRVFGKRDYIPGDSLRRVDWKATANLRRLQVKLFEPSIDFECMILLNLNLSEYDLKWQVSSSELAVVISASIANWVTEIHQSIGISTNGVDPLSDDQSPISFPPRKGRGHLLKILEQLARIQAANTTPFVELLQKEAVNRSWGTTLMLITNQVGEELMDGLSQIQKSGLSAILIICGSTPSKEIERKVNYFGVPVFSFLNEQDLKVWRS